VGVVGSNPIAPTNYL